MGEFKLYASPGDTQGERIRAVRDHALTRQDEVSQFPIEGRPGWVVLVIRGPENGSDMRGEYRALDYLGLLGEPPG